MPSVSVSTPSDDAELPRTLRAVGAVLLLASLAGLVYYKWGGAAVAVHGVRAGAWHPATGRLTTGRMLAASVEYLRRIWIALLFGLLIGATVKAFIPPRRLAMLVAGGGTMRRQLSAALSGAPLMLCSCCITPVFSGVWQSGVRLAPALTLMLASPALNPAALLLTFLLFPPAMGIARLLAALAIVLLAPPVVAHLAGRGVPLPARVLPAPDDDAADLAGRGVRRFARALGDVAWSTLPLVLVAVLASSLILPYTLSIARHGSLLVVPAVAAVAVPVALPTYVELPLALLFMAFGAPGAAMAMLVAGPAVNLPSLLVLGRETRPAVAAALAVAVWAAATATGLAIAA